MANKLWYWVAGAAIILVGGFLGYRVLYPQSVSVEPSASSPPTSSTNPSCLPKDDLSTSVTLEYRDRKFFAPGATEATTTICVPVGGTVTWVNESSEDLWIASNPHPIHTDLSGFDALASKSSYSYTFTKADTWGYHNHRNPAVTGAVIVVE